MQPHELKPFSDALLGVFDALGARPPGSAGIEVWFRTLRGYSLPEVVDALDAWIARNAKAPTPAALADSCRDRAIERREREAAQAKVAEQNAPFEMARTEDGRRSLRALRGVVAGMHRPSGGLQRGWADRVIDRYIDGDPSLAQAAFECACDALGKTAEERDELRQVRDAAAQRRAAA